VNAFYWERHPEGPFATIIGVAATYCGPDAYDGAYQDLVRRARAAAADGDELCVFKAVARPVRGRAGRGYLSLGSRPVRWTGLRGGVLGGFLRLFGVRGFGAEQDAGQLVAGVQELVQGGGQVGVGDADRAVGVGFGRFGIGLAGRGWRAGGNRRSRRSPCAASSRCR
jgi:hypothetical protein